jgi:hypothetical protein
MPTLPTRSFATIVQTLVAGVQGRASKLINFAIGSTLRAIAEGFAGLFLWFQSLVLQLLTAIRLSTSQGTDVDTFTADFMPIIPGSQTAALPGGSPRLGAQYASGQVTFTRFTAGASTIFIPVGFNVQTSDGSQTFAVTGDPTLGTYTPAIGNAPAGYTMAAGIASLIVPVEALVPGSAGNIAAGAISVISSTASGVSPDTVVNNAPFTNGADEESDSALKARFSAYILGLSRGDIYGLDASIDGTAVTVQYKLTESYNLDGSWHPGFFFVVADDGSGSPSAAFLQIIKNAVWAVRPLSIWPAVFPPTIIWAEPSLQIQTAPGYDHNTVVGIVEATIVENINALGLGNDLDINRLAAWAYSVPGVTKVLDVQINDVSGDGGSLNTWTLTQDGLWKIYASTIKCQTCIVS